MIAEIFPGLPQHQKDWVIVNFKYLDHPKQPEFIIDVVSECLKVGKYLIVGIGQKRKFVEARQIAMYILKNKMKLPLKKIGAIFNDRDHSTVIYSIRTVRDLMDTNPKFREKVNKIEEIVNNLYK